jgi:hypothetical protein
VQNPYLELLGLNTEELFLHSGTTQKKITLMKSLPALCLHKNLLTCAVVALFLVSVLSACEKSSNTDGFVVINVANASIKNFESYEYCRIQLQTYPRAKRLVRLVRQLERRHPEIPDGSSYYHISYYKTENPDVAVHSVAIGIGSRGKARRLEKMIDEACVQE